MFCLFTSKLTCVTFGQHIWFQHCIVYDLAFLSFSANKQIFCQVCATKTSMLLYCEVHRHKLCNKLWNLLLVFALFNNFTLFLFCNKLQRWFMYPPGKAPHFHPNRTTLQWLYEDYPELHPLELPLDCTIGPGDVCLLFPLVSSCFGCTYLLACSAW